MKAHPLAEIFPLMSGAEFDGLVADVKAHGLREKIVLHEGMILDGRNRFRACDAAGVMPKFTEWRGEGSIESYVVSKNLHRRHLNESQRAMIAAKLASLAVGRPSERSENQTVQICTISVPASEAAEMLGVGRHSVFHAKKVLAEGTREEIAAVESGEAAVSTIAKQIKAKEPPDRRKKARDTSLAQVGKNPERIQNAQINAEIWGRVRDALTHLTSLPLPVDVVSIVSAHDRTGLVDARLNQSIEWLKDFANGWASRNQNAA